MKKEAKQKQLSINLTDHYKLKIISSWNGISIKDTITLIIEEYLENNNINLNLKK